MLSNEALKKFKAGDILSEDKIVELYKLAKEEKNNNLMRLVESFKINETIKKSDLESIIREIVSGVLKEIQEPSSPQSTIPLDTPYGVIDTHTKKVVYKTTYKNRARAMRLADAKDNKYGAYRYKAMILKDKHVNEMTTTGAVSGFNVPSAFSRRGGSERGVEGSKSLGYELTPVGKKDMDRDGDAL
jgi:hypothetical protein